MIMIIAFILSTAGDTLVLDLDAAVNYALINNTEIKNLALDQEQARDKVREALGNFYPSLTATGYFAYLTEVPVIDFGGMPIPLGQHENYNVQVSLQQVLFAWGKLRDAYRLADINRSIAELMLQRKRQDICFRVTQSYYSLLVLKEMVTLTTESYRQLQRHEAAVRKRYEAGLVSQYDLLRAQVEVANIKPRVMEAENGLQLALNGFQMLLGMNLNQPFNIAGELDLSAETFDLDSLTMQALGNRPEIKSLEHAVQIGEISRSLIRRTNLPTIVAGATYAYEKPTGMTDNEWGSKLTFNLGFNMPIFSGFKTAAQVRQADLAIEKSRLAIEDVRKGIILEVKNAYYTFESSRELVAAARENLGQADRAVAMIETRYKNGLATNLEYLDIQLAQMQARTNYLNAVKDYHHARAAIFRAIGKEY